MLVDYVSRKNRSRALQRFNSTREISVASVFLQKRCANGADGPRSQIGGRVDETRKSLSWGRQLVFHVGKTAFRWCASALKYTE